MSEPRQAYPSDVTDDERAFIAPYLALVREDSPQRVHDLREVFNALRYIVKTGGQWRFTPNDFPPWQAVGPRARRWVAARAFEHAADDLRVILRVVAGKGPSPSAAVLDGRTVQSTPESGSRAGYDGHRKRNGSKVADRGDLVRPPGHLLCRRSSGHGLPSPELLRRLL